MPEKIWVFDTVSLSNFLLSDAILLLKTRYRKRGVITSETFDEISSGIAEYPKLNQVDSLIDNKIFKLINLSRTEHEHFRKLIGHLGKGEASCIAYAKEQRAIVVTDDRAARRQCAIMKIAVTGTIGILKASVLDGHATLDQADELLQKMIKAGFYSPIRSVADIM